MNVINEEKLKKEIKQMKDEEALCVGQLNQIRGGIVVAEKLLNFLTKKEVENVA